jgi:undecaprenyl-diphosphatase
MRGLSRLDRRLGRALRARVGVVPGGVATARAIASAMSPAFRLAVAALILRRRTRAVGLRCLGAGVAAGTGARLLRDRLGRRRPGARAQGGFPSRHAAAAAAITRAATPGAPRVARALAAGAVLGMVARVACAEHDPADIAAGAALGLASARALELLAPPARECGSS